MDSATTRQWLNSCTESLREVGIESAQLDSELLLSHQLGVNREWLKAHDTDQISAADLEKASQLVARRMKREPLAYIVGSKEFYGRAFLVTDDTLIPRPESESMIDLLKSYAESNGITSVIDVGTGSGCLAITVKLESPRIDVIATDISSSALRIAMQNAIKLDADVRPLESNLLSQVPTSTFHLPTTILANLPYVPTSLEVSAEVQAEPNLAVFSGNDGLDCLRAFWVQISEFKNKPQAVITESLVIQHDAVEKLARGARYKLAQTEGLAQLFTLN